MSQWFFSMRTPTKQTACEACVFGRGKHAEWCQKLRPDKLIADECVFLTTERQWAYATLERAGFFKRAATPTPKGRE